MDKYIEGGGSILVLMGEGGEVKSQTNINYLLEQYGISFNNGMHLWNYLILLSFIIMINAQCTIS